MDFIDTTDKRKEAEASEIINSFAKEMPIVKDFMNHKEAFNSNKYIREKM
jgi:hypothetical protein